MLTSSYSEAKIRRAFKLKSFEKLCQLGIGSKLMVEACTPGIGEVTLKIDGDDDWDRRRRPTPPGVHIASRTLEAGTDWSWIETNATFPQNPMMKFEICCRDRRGWRGHYGPKIKRIHVSLHCLTADQLAKWRPYVE